MEIPRNIVVGDSVEWVDYFGGYLSPEWSLRYVLICPLTKIEVVSVADAETDGHLFSIPSTTTDSWQPGDYHYQVYATSGSDRKTIGRGFLTIEIDFSKQEKHDARPWLDRVIAALMASIEGRASSSQLLMEISGSRIEHIFHLDQRELLNGYKKYRAARNRSRAISRGESPFGTVWVKF
ncbi:MAG: hypothetical protein ACI8PB_003857 [Desulforhopalus sp.]|jgi:hypothetical protein